MNLHIELNNDFSLPVHKLLMSISDSKNGTQHLMMIINVLHCYLILNLTQIMILQLDTSSWVKQKIYISQYLMEFQLIFPIRGHVWPSSPACILYRSHIALSR